MIGVYYQSNCYPYINNDCSVGLVVELFTPRFGLLGIIGLAAFILFFYGHLVAGLS